MVQRSRVMVQALMYINDAPGIARLARGRTSFAHCRSSKMMDVIMLAIGLGFFVLSVGYCYACDRL